MVNFTAWPLYSPRYTLNASLDGWEDQYWRFQYRKVSCSCRETNHHFSVFKPAVWSLDILRQTRPSTFSIEVARRFARDLNQRQSSSKGTRTGLAVKLEAEMHYMAVNCKIQGGIRRSWWPCVPRRSNLSTHHPVVFSGFGVSARCAREIYRRRFGNNCTCHLHWSWIGIRITRLVGCFLVWVLSEDGPNLWCVGTHSSFRNVVGKFTLHAVLKSQSQNTVKVYAAASANNFAAYILMFSRSVIVAWWCPLEGAETCSTHIV